MRIVAGTLGGRRITAPPGAATRPTTDRVREAIFSILGPPPPDTRVLDLFAGSGAMAAEALSRGAVAATLVESARGALAIVRRNVDALALGDRARIHAGDALQFLRAAPGDLYRWVFVDPPYASTLATDALAALPPHLDAGAVIVVEHDRRHAPPAAVGNLVRTDVRRYGDTEVSFFSISNAIP
jgi:16S rRNA (guanine966-N2)-methyltransferase